MPAQFAAMKPHSRCILVETLSTQCTAVKQRSSLMSAASKMLSASELLAEVEFRGKMNSLQQGRAVAHSQM